MDSLGHKGLFNSFPAVCQCHGNAPTQPLDSPEAFLRCSPHGGCNQQCTVPLPTCPMGHICPRRCHLQFKLGTDVHRGVLCQVKVSEKCPNGHPVFRICCNSKCHLCKEEVRDDCPMGHVRLRQCSNPPLRLQDNVILNNAYNN